MPPSKYATIKKLPVIEVICWFCKEPIEEEQKEKGRACCLDCEYRIFIKPTMKNPDKPITYKEFMRQRDQQEKEIFMKMMERLYRRLF